MPRLSLWTTSSFPWQPRPSRYLWVANLILLVSLWSLSLMTLTTPRAMSTCSTTCNWSMNNLFLREIRGLSLVRLKTNGIP
uniref:Uncharacterized protein n=1 Tax=Rhizophora mucronata TaxID=61149 RepID=A0A2P2N2B1_RHIMU